MEITEDTPNVQSISCEVEPTTGINKQEDDCSKSKHDSTVSSNEKHSLDYLLHCPKIEDEGSKVGNPIKNQRSRLMLVQ